MYSMTTIVNNYRIAYFKVAKRVNLLFFLPKMLMRINILMLMRILYTAETQLKTHCFDLVYVLHFYSLRMLFQFKRVNLKSYYHTKKIL